MNILKSSNSLIAACLGVMFATGLTALPTTASAVTVEVHEVREMDPVKMERYVVNLEEALRDQMNKAIRVTMACDGTKCAVDSHAPVKSMSDCEASITSSDTNAFCVPAANGDEETPRYGDP